MEIPIAYRKPNESWIDFNSLPSGSFRISYLAKKSKTLEFFEDLYTYPPKFRVKWEILDELQDDLFTSYNYRLLNSNPNFVEKVTPFFSNSERSLTEQTSYNLGSYLDGYLNKITSNRFYHKRVQSLQNKLQSVPVYVVLNGQGDIIVSTSNDSSSIESNSFTKTLYNFCGGFDPVVQQNNSLGLFFMSKTDAEVYLNEIAKSDTQGTRMFGLSIHCFSLDFAYRVTREYHPGVDFRFVPDLTEVQTLLTAASSQNNDLIFEDGQQQLRLLQRPTSSIPFLHKFFLFSPFSKKAECLKGVPVYIVKVKEDPTNFFVNKYHASVNLIGNTIGLLTRPISIVTGFGNNQVLQSSFKQQSSDLKTKSYVFFEREAASDFCKHHGRRVYRYKSSHSSIFQPPVKNTRILVYNLEDLLELCEETLIEPAPNTDLTKQTLDTTLNSIQFVPSKSVILDVKNYSQSNRKQPLKGIIQFFDFKYRCLISFCETLLNTD